VLYEAIAAEASPGGRILRGANREAVNPLARATGIVSAVALALWLLSVVQPPLPTAPGLDQSWRIGLTMATLEHLQFGRDVVFTFGPLGFVLQGIADPALAVPAALIAAALAALAGAGIWLVFAGRAPAVQKLALALGLVALGTLYSFDYVVLAGVLALLVRGGRFPRLAPLTGAAVGAAALFGVLSKYTLGIDVLAAAAAVWLVDLVRGPARRRRAALVAGGVCAAIVALGTGAAFGFNPGAVAAYLRTASEVLAGYSDAMALVGPRAPVMAALLVAAAILTVAVAGSRERKPAVLALAAVTLFLTWKHGFVRQDAHVLAFFVTAAVLAPLVGSTVRGRLATWLAAGASACALAALVWAVATTYAPFPPLFEPARIAHGAAFLLHPRATEAGLAAASDAALAPDRLAPDVLRRIGSAAVDALPVETALVKANGLRWAPLPVFQAYSAYTPALDALNRAELVRAGAPYVLYRYEAIDGRFPFGDMPATTAELLCRYDLALADAPTAGGDRFMLLARSARGSCAAAPAGAAVNAVVGDAIAVPAARPGTFVSAAFALRPSLTTRIASALWRAPQVALELRLDDGSVRRYRAVAATLGDGVIVSAAPRDEAEAARLLGGAPVPAVRSIAVIALPGTYALGGVTFTRLRRSPPR
jgi:hypothetical protein